MQQNRLEVVVRFSFSGSLEDVQMLFDSDEKTSGLKVVPADSPGEFLVDMLVDVEVSGQPAVSAAVGVVTHRLDDLIRPPEPCIRVMAICEPPEPSAPDSKQFSGERALEQRLIGILAVLEEVDKRRSEGEHAGRSAKDVITEAEYAEVYRFALGGTPPELSADKGV